MARTHAAVLALVLASLAAALGILAGGAGASGRAPQDVPQTRPARLACYPAQFGVFTPRKLALVDQLARLLSVSVSLPDTVCAPAVGSNSGADSTSYLTCYRIRVATRFTSTVVRATDEFGKLTMRLFRPRELCVPSARVDQDSAAVPEKGLDLLTCYQSKPSTATTPHSVSVVDEFGQSNDTIKDPSRLCVPATKKGSAPRKPQPSMTCYSIESNTKATTIVVHNEFGFLKAALGPRGRLCVSSTLS
jgi:hypothetical protein